jgi:hypothetical protein
LQHQGLQLSQQAKLGRTNNNGALSNSISSSSRLDTSPLVLIRCPRGRSVPLEQVRQAFKTIRDSSSTSTITLDHPVHLVPQVVLGVVVSQLGASPATQEEATIMLAMEETTRTQVMGQQQVGEAHLVHLAPQAHLVHLEEMEGEDPQTLLTTTMRMDRGEGGDTHEGPGTVGVIVAPTQLTSLEQVTTSSSKHIRVPSSSRSSTRQGECTFHLV